LFQLLCICSMLHAGPEGPATRYPHADLLMEASELANAPVARRDHILDARPHDAYVRGHIPHAIWVDESAWAKAFAAGQKLADWQKRVGALGISEDTPTVVYGTGSTPDGARIWWILHYWGVQDVRLLDGGWYAWTAGHHPISTEETEPSAVTAQLSAHPDRLATKDQVLAALDKHGFQILDARSEGEYCGSRKMARRGGAIPGATHLEWTQVIDPKTHRFRSADELAAIFHRAHVDLDGIAVTHCQSGGRAAVLAFALELMGGKHVRNYYRGWSEWGNDVHTPIVRPAPAK